MEINVNNYRGLNQDLGYDVIQDLYTDAQNIRISTTKGKSGGSWTNIKGQSVFFVLPDGDALVRSGYKEIIGYTTIRNIIILFVADDSGTNGWIYKILYDESLNYVSTTLLYANAGLNFNKERPIKAIGRYENDNIQRVFWSDYEEFLRSINIADPNLLTQPLEQIDIYPSVSWTQPIIKEVQPGGELLNGVWQVSYKLTTIDGKETLISPPSVVVHITDSSEANDSQQYVGGLKGKNSGKSILVEIDTTNYTDFNTLVVYAILNDTLNGTPQVFEVDTITISGATSVECLITGNEFVSNISLDEYTSKTLPFKTVKTLTQKDGSLVVSNIKEVRVSIQDLLEIGETFDVRAGRYNSLGILPNTGGTEADKLNNAFNEDYNKDAHWSGDWHTSEQFKYQSDGVTLGGEGPNLSYKFHLEPAIIDNVGSGIGSGVLPSSPPPPALDSYTYYNGSYPSPASPQLSGLIRGFKRGETYRVGIVGYTAKGEVTFVEFVGDIKFPDISDEDGTNNATGTPYFPLSKRSGDNTIAYNLGLEFTIDFTSCPSLLTKLSGWQVVRVQRTNRDKRRLTSGILNTFHTFPIGTAGPDYDFSGPGGAQIHHLYGGQGNQGNFAYLQTQFNPVLSAISGRVIGDAFCFYSPEISFNFNNFKETLSSIGNSYMLITGAYLNYTSSSDSYHNNTFEIYDTAGVEDLGQITDLRKKLSNVSPIDKTTSLAPYDGVTYDILERGVEYIRKIDKKQFATFKNKLDDTSLDFDVVTGPYDLTLGSAYLRNYFVNIPDDVAYSLNTPDNNVASILFKGASGLQGNLSLINTDPLEGTPLVPFSTENCFKGGNLTTATSSYVAPLTNSLFQESRPIIDILLAKSEIYGGYSEDALFNNTFMPCSPVYPMTELTPKVFGGDTFLNMWTFQEATTWNERTFYNLASNNAYKYTNQRTITTHIVVESSVNIDLNYGSTIKQGVKYDVYGSGTGIQHPRYRQETNNWSTDYGLFKDMYKYNDVYSRENKDLSFFVQPRDAQNINYVNDIRTYLSNVKTNGELIDSWTKFGILNFWDVDDYGPINEILNWKNNVFFFQDKAFGTLSINPRALITPADGQITELGSAQGIVDHLYISEVHGSAHQWAIKATDTSIYFYDTLHRKIFMFQGSNTPLSEILGLHSFLNNLPASINNRKENTGDNPILFKGVHIGRDLINDEVLFTFLTSGEAVHLTINTLYTIGTLVKYLYEGETLVRKITTQYTSGNISSSALIAQLIPNSVEYFADFTLVLDELQQQFSSFYTAKPQIYIENNNLLLSPPPGQSALGVSGLFKHNSGDYGTFYSWVKESYIQIIVNPKSEVNKVLRFLEFTSIVKTDAQVISRLESITAFRIHNEYQDTGKVTISSSNLKRKFDKWRLKIPRDINSTNQRGRLRSSYFIVTLYYDNSTNKELIMNRLFSYYDIQIF